MYQLHQLVGTELVLLDIGTTECVLFLLSLAIAMFKLVRSTFQNGGGSPWSRKFILEFIDNALLGVRSNCAPRKDNVAD